MSLPQHDFSTPSICCLACKDILVHRIVLPYLVPLFHGPTRATPGVAGP